MSRDDVHEEIGRLRRLLRILALRVERVEAELDELRRDRGAGPRASWRQLRLDAYYDPGVELREEPAGGQLVGPRDRARSELSEALIRMGLAFVAGLNLLAGLILLATVRAAEWVSMELELAEERRRLRERRARQRRSRDRVWESQKEWV
ncbi:MAG: hypothetical protein QXP81_06405 [Nitrososphaerota archaeon]